jgi:hypothetical protein
MPGEPFDAAEETLDDGQEVAVEQEASEEQGEDQQEEGGKPVRGNPFARLRIVERENKVMSARFNELIDRLTPKEREEAEEEIEVPDFDANPLAAIHAQQRRTETRIEKMERAAREKEAKREFQSAITIANEAIKDFAEETPDYSDAIKHLCAVDYEEAMDENPELSEKEVDNLLTQKLEQKKLNWLRAGKDPGEELYKRAIKKGYAPGSESKKGPDAKEIIAADKKRAAAGASIAKAAGRASEGKVTASAIARMTDAEYREWADRLAKEKGGVRLRTRDISADKIRSNR